MYVMQCVLLYCVSRWKSVASASVIKFNDLRRENRLVFVAVQLIHRCFEKCFKRDPHCGSTGFRITCFVSFKNSKRKQKQPTACAWFIAGFCARTLPTSAGFYEWKCVTLRDLPRNIHGCLAAVDARVLCTLNHPSHPPPRFPTPAGSAALISLRPGRITRELWMAGKAPGRSQNLVNICEMQ